MSYCSIDFGPKLLLGTADNSEHEPALAVAIRELWQLNFRYLRLIAREDSAGRIGCQLNRLSESSLLALSESLFSFFTVAFDDSARWMPLFAGHGNESDHDDLVHDDRVDFVETVVFFAWHLACADEIVAKAILQLDERIALELRRLPIGSLRPISVRANDLLAPRWIDNDFFWSTLIRCSSDSYGSGMQSVKLLGRQLLAAESLGLGGATNVYPHSPSMKGTNHPQKLHSQGKVRRNRQSRTVAHVTG